MRNLDGVAASSSVAVDGQAQHTSCVCEAGSGYRPLIVFQSCEVVGLH